MRVRELLYVALCLAAAVVLTWPLVSVFTTHIIGGAGDTHLTLWSMRWLHDAVLSLQNPFFTSRLYHPQGTTLVFHTFDLPSAVLVLPLWDWMPELAVYNTAVLAAFALTVYGMFRLAREITNDAPSALLAGIVFAAVPYHFAHIGHLHLISMGWLPLYVVHLLRILTGSARGRDAIFGGVFLGLATLASWYHLLYAAAITVPLIGYACLRHRATCISGRAARQLLMLSLTVLLLAGPLIVALMVARQREPILGVHDAVTFSADAFSFFVPNSIQTRCTENDGNVNWGREGSEHATYAGYTVLALALLGASVQRLGRAFLLVAGVGALLALGPYLQWGGEVLGVRMPFWYLEHLLPVLQFSGVPVRFGYVMYFGLVTAAAMGLARLRRVQPVAVGSVLACAAAVLALYEYRPCPTVAFASPVPPMMRAWATDPRPWAVLDVSSGWGQMWHATIHRKPIIGGYLGRVPKRLEDWIWRQPVLRAVSFPDGQLSFSQVAPQIDFARPDPGLVGDHFEAEWSGTLLAPTTGTYRFWLTTNAWAQLRVGRASIAQTMMIPSDGKSRDTPASLTLRAGPHPISLHLVDAGPTSELRLSWAPPDGDRTIIPADALRTAADGVGLDGEYLQHIPPLSGLGRANGRASLRDLHVRYVVTADRDNPCVQDELALPEIYRGDDIRVYEVPDAE